ncbi:MULTISPECIES: DUF302 domain-containing protein [unclassified Bradyrhizobium]|uniref:DUF302 domain-containing protein n=1 Tax=unclassified Bradyrhizobium TaxID=2631580 RepID=UPI0029163AA1|nr:MULTISPECIES: DUF302 domain-containing protein [unclassified Bradyrhizobium]
MTYYFAKAVNLSFDAAIERVTAELKARGFGVLTRIDVQATLREKIGADFRPYTILGACNPKLAHEALQAESRIGTMLPCNVIVQDVGGRVEVAAVNPVASMQAIENAALATLATKVSDALKAVVEAV